MANDNEKDSKDDIDTSDFKEKSDEIFDSTEENEDEDGFDADELEDLEELEEGAEETEYKESMLDSLKGMIVPIVIGGGLMVFFAFKLIDLFKSPVTASPQEQVSTQFTAPTAPAPQQQVTTNPEQVAPQPQQPQADSPVAPDATAPVTGEQRFDTDLPGDTRSQTYKVISRDILKDINQQQQQTMEETSKTIAEIDARTKETRNQFESLAKGMVIVDKKVTNIETDFKELNERMEKIQQAIISLAKGLDNLKVAPSAPSRGTVQPAPAAPQRPAQPSSATPPKAASSPTRATVSSEYQIEAAIPGRAWIKREDGRTITVREGDEIEKLGKVIAIDAQGNAVITSSGVVIR